MIRVRYEDTIVDSERIIVGGRTIQSDHITYTLIQERWTPVLVLIVITFAVSAIFLGFFILNFISVLILFILIIGICREYKRRFVVIINGIDFESIAIYGLNRVNASQIADIRNKLFDDPLRRSFGSDI